MTAVTSVPPTGDQFEKGNDRTNSLINVKGHLLVCIL